MSENYLIHFGNKNSGRYPRGSGERPHQHDGMNIVLSPTASKQLKKLRVAEKVENSLMAVSTLGATIIANLLSPSIGTGVAAVGSMYTIRYIRNNARRLREKGYNIIKKDLDLKNTMYNDIALRNTIPNPLKVKKVKNKKEESQFWKDYYKQVANNEI